MNRIISNSACLPCNITEAFDMFTINKHLESWLCVLADVDPVPGGRYELFWNPDNREDDSTLGCRISSIEYGRHIAFEWKGPSQFKDFMNDADPLTHVIIVFFPTGTGCSKINSTKVQLLHMGWRNTIEWEEARIWFSEAWEKSLYKLEKYFAKKIFAKSPGNYK